MIDEMPPDVKLEALDLQKCWGVWYFSSVRCILSNSVASPLFQKVGPVHDHPRSMDLAEVQARAKIRAIGASQDAKGMWRIQFMDKARNMLYEYNPDRHNHGTTVFEMAANEELIGVYGVKDKQSYFTSFGFLVLQTI